MVFVFVTFDHLKVFSDMRWDLFGVQPVAVPGMAHFPDKPQRSRDPLFQGTIPFVGQWFGGDWNLCRPPPGGD